MTTMCHVFFSGNLAFCLAQIWVLFPLLLIVAKEEMTHYGSDICKASSWYVNICLKQCTNFTLLERKEQKAKSM